MSSKSFTWKLVNGWARLNSSPPFPVDKSSSSRLFTAALYGLFVFLFLILFQPFGLTGLPINLILWVGIKYALATFLVALANSFIKSRLNSWVNVWSIKMELFYTISVLFQIGLSNAMLVGFDRPEITFSDLFWPVQLHTFILGIIPVAIQALLESNIHLRRRSKTTKTESKTADSHVLLKDIKGNHVRVLKSTIIFVASDDHYQKVLTKDSFYYVRETLKSLQAILGDEGFKQVHRSTIVNLEHIKSFKPYGNGELFLNMSNGQDVKVSRSYGKKIRNLIKAAKS